MDSIFDAFRIRRWHPDFDCPHAVRMRNLSHEGFSCLFRGVVSNSNVCSCFGKSVYDVMSDTLRAPSDEGGASTQRQ
jgi:hypothetical protein